MATISIPDQQRRLTDPQEISTFLSQFGIWFDRWDVEGRIGPDASNEEILAAYQPEIEQLKARGGYVTADVINVSPQTPGLDQMLSKFNKEHTHSEDEVRFTVRGGGVFHIHPENGPVFAIQVESGDLINVPAGTKHWFDLCNDRTIRCIRLFLDMSGWSPAYTHSGVDQGYAPLCWGTQYVASGERVENQAIKI